jgi:acyl-homoserine-lactone acylase
MALELASAQPPSPSSTQALSQRVMRAVLTPRALSAELFKADLLVPVCARPMVGQVDLTRACEVLRRWPNRSDASDRGALLWDAFWARLEDSIPAAEFYRVPFSREAPLDTPRAPNADDPRVALALAATVASFAEHGWALDAPLASQRFVRSGGRALALYGGCHGAGYFSVLCDGDGSHPIGSNAVSNSYLQVVRFGPRGVQAHTLLAHGEDELAIDNGPGTAPVARYARKAWLRFPFRENEIARDPGLRRIVLTP